MNWLKNKKGYDLTDYPKYPHDNSGNKELSFFKGTRDVSGSPDLDIGVSRNSEELGGQVMEKKEVFPNEQKMPKSVDNPSNSYGPINNPQKIKDDSFHPGPMRKRIKWLKDKFDMNDVKE